MPSFLFVPTPQETFQYDLVLASGWTNYNLFQVIGEPAHSVSVQLTIEEGAVISSATASGGSAALVIDGFEEGSVLRIVNHGRIVAKGGNGGAGGSGKVFSRVVQGGGGGGGAGTSPGSGGAIGGTGATAGTSGASESGGTGGESFFGGSNGDFASTAGEGGGNAIYTNCPVTIHNYGEIWGGGGGGAGGNPTGFDADGENQGTGGDGGGPGQPGEGVYGLGGQLVRAGGPAGLSILRSAGTEVILIDEPTGDIRGDQSEQEVPS